MYVLFGVVIDLRVLYLFNSIKRCAPIICRDGRGLDGDVEIKTRSCSISLGCSTTRT